MAPGWRRQFVEPSELSHLYASMFIWRSKQVSKAITQESASPSGQPLRREMHSSAAWAGQAHSPAAGARQACVATYVTMHRPVPQSCPFPWDIWTEPNLIRGFLVHMSQPPKRHLDRFSRFFHISPVCLRHRPTDRAARQTVSQTDRQTDGRTDGRTTLCATSAAICRIYALCACKSA